jgi:glycosyltransferase involved in cell wall biosynthesis
LSDDLGHVAADLVSAVIPTTGRTELARAIRSVRAQTGRWRTEVVVVNDSPDESATHGVDADVVVWTGGGRRGGFARNRGVEASHGRFIAFLDDDDEWTTGKLDAQLPLIEGAEPDVATIVAGRHVHVSAATSDVSTAGPRDLIRAGESVESYLFRRRTPSLGRASMYTSTLLCDRRLALAVPWREDLARHQDWDWLVRAGRVPGVRFRQTPEVVARIQTGSTRSISASADWHASLSWATETLHEPHVHVDFVAAQTLRYALNAGSPRGVGAVLRAIAVRRRLPSLGPLVVGMAGLLPRHRLESLMVRRRAGGSAVRPTGSSR